jgi:hypothetical protein
MAIRAAVAQSVRISAFILINAAVRSITDAGCEMSSI